LSGRTSTSAWSASAVGVPLSVGNFSIHTPWTTHGSRPNRSAQVRKALILEFSPGTLSAARQVGPALVGAHVPTVRSGVAHTSG
jgi:ectoine hydroxylase-related dioxygenase (phytanoyl-CoA dioxygenase family)